MKLTAAQKAYATILNGGHGRDVEFIANVIMTSATKPTTKMKNLIRRLASGDEIRTANDIFSIRINGKVHSLSSLDS